MWIIIGSALELPIGGYISLGIYILIGIAISLIMANLRKNDPEGLALITLTPDDIDKESA